MAGSVSLHVFRSARRHLADARHCEALRRASPIPSVQASAAEAYSRAVDNLVTEMTQLDTMGVMDRLEAFLKDSG